MTGTLPRPAHTCEFMANAFDFESSIESEFPLHSYSVCECTHSTASGYLIKQSDLTGIVICCHTKHVNNVR